MHFLELNGHSLQLERETVNPGQIQCAPHVWQGQSVNDIKRRAQKRASMVF